MKAAKYNYEGLVVEVMDDGGFSLTISDTPDGEGLGYGAGLPPEHTERYLLGLEAWLRQVLAREPVS